MSQLGLPSWARVSEARLAHIKRVADLLARWAAEMNVAPRERERWIKAAYLHDALRDADPAFLEQLAPECWGIPALRHGPAAAVMAARDGEKDQGVLDAVRYHSVGFKGWDRVGRMLYLADYLEPGRPYQEAEREALASRVPSEPDAVLREVVAARLHWAVEAGRPLIPETVDLWNALWSHDFRRG